MLNQKGYKTAVVVFGTAMFEEAKKMGVNDRDELRKLSIEMQRTSTEIWLRKESQK